MRINRRVLWCLGLAVPIVLLAEHVVAGDESTDAIEPSRAAWWLAQDGVEPIADLVNTAGPESAPKFVDRVGEFRVTAHDRALTISGPFPKANVWRFDLTTFDDQFDIRTLYVEYGKCAFPDPRSIGTARPRHHRTRRLIRIGDLPWG